MDARQASHASSKQPKEAGKQEHIFRHEYELAPMVEQNANIMQERLATKLRRRLQSAIAAGDLTSEDANLSPRTSFDAQAAASCMPLHRPAAGVELTNIIPLSNPSVLTGALQCSAMFVEPVPRHCQHLMDAFHAHSHFLRLTSRPCCWH
jgi:hypothetical protein